MTWIVEVVHERERQAMGLCQPIAHFRRVLAEKVTQPLLVLFVRFALNIRREEIGRVVNTKLSLDTGSSRWDQTGGKRR